MLDETVVDGRLVVFEHPGRPLFNRLQNPGSPKVPMFYYAFYVLVPAGRDLRSQTLLKVSDDPGRVAHFS
jgi:hypothetical protein